MYILIQTVERFYYKVEYMLNQTYGLLLSAIVLLFNFISPVKYAFLAMGIAIIGDLLFGIVSAKKQNKFIRSLLMRDTPTKIFIYLGFMLVVYFAERIFSTGDTALFTKMGCTLACACELWSMAGSALIICPRMPFPRILKVQLRGEIESKLGKNITNILDDKENDTNKGNQE